MYPLLHQFDLFIYLHIIFYQLFYILNEKSRTIYVILIYKIIYQYFEIHTNAIQYFINLKTPYLFTSKNSKKEISSCVFAFYIIRGVTLFIRLVLIVNMLNMLIIYWLVSIYLISLFVLKLPFIYIHYFLLYCVLYI